MQPIKNLIPKPSKTLLNPSATITSPSKPLAQISQQTGGLGSQITCTTTASELGRAMEQADPQATYKTVRALLPSAINFALKPVYNGANTLTGYVLKGAHGPNEISLSTSILAKSLTPITMPEAIDLITELRLLTRPSPGMEADQLAQAKIYINRMLEYPADVVRHVLKTQTTFSPWWPSWQELHERLEINSYRRRMMLAALQPQ